MLNTSSKRVIVLTVVTLVIFLFLFLLIKPIPEVQIDANEITFNTPEELDAAADLIMIASPTKEFMVREHKVTFFDDGTIQDYYTLTEVQVDKVIKAPTNFQLSNNNTINIIEPVGIAGRSTKRKLVTNHYKELKEKTSYILFLKQNSMGQYAIINNNLGKFNLDKKDPLDIGEKQTLEDKKFKNDVLEKYSID